MLAGLQQCQRMALGNSGTLTVRYSTTSLQELSNFFYSVRYQLSEDPKLLKSTEVPELSNCQSPKIALSPDARVAAVSVNQEENSSIFLYPTASDDSVERISIINIHKGELFR